MKVVAAVTFDAAGSGSCLYTELIDLQSIGSLEVRRASFIEFNNERQVWEVKTGSGRVLFFSRRRIDCLAWEQSGEFSPGALKEGP